MGYSGDAVYPGDAGYPKDFGYPGDIGSVLVTEERLRCRTAELAEQVATDFRAEHGKGDLLLVGVLKGAVMFMRYIGFDIPNEFVVGYGLDYGERYRDLPYIGTLDPKVYTN